MNGSAFSQNPQEQGESLHWVQPSMFLAFSSTTIIKFDLIRGVVWGGGEDKHQSSNAGNSTYITLKVLCENLQLLRVFLQLRDVSDGVQQGISVSCTHTNTLA